MLELKNIKKGTLIKEIEYWFSGTNQYSNPPASEKCYIVIDIRPETEFVWIECYCLNKKMFETIYLDMETLFDLDLNKKCINDRSEMEIIF